jgi:hypothetical protein
MRKEAAVGTWRDFRRINKNNKKIKNTNKSKNNKNIKSNAFFLQKIINKKKKSI